MSTIEERLAALEEKTAEFEARLENDRLWFEEANDSLRSFAERINEYGARAEKGVSEIYERVARTLSSLSNDLYQHFSEKVAADVTAKITPDVIAESLTKRVLVTRPASQSELKSGLDVVAVRQATREEIAHNQS